MDKNTKQVIIWRNDLKVRTGKKMAMASHASMAFLTRDGFIGQVYNDNVFINIELGVKHLDEIDHWLKNSFRKIVLYVNTEEELRELHQKALDKGLMSHIIVDNGTTEFNGVPTTTALAIGPAWDFKFEGLTDHLKLL